MTTLTYDLHALENELVSIDETIENLSAMASEIESGQVLTMESALGVERLLPGRSVLSAYFGHQSKVEKTKLALEEIHMGVLAAVAAGIAALVTIVVKLINWLRGKANPTHPTFLATPAQVTEVKAVLKDPELVHAVDEAMMLAHQTHPALEDAAPHTGIKINDVFETFKGSLTEPEVDFLTSGHRYKVIKEVVEDFSRGHYPDFIEGISKEVKEWIQKGLDRTPHVGRDEDVVSRFVHEEKRKLEGIRAKYGTRISGINEMERLTQDHNAKGSYEHLQLFQKKPSALFPHLEHLWESVKFEKISDDDKDLLASLDRVKKRFEESGKYVNAKLNSSQTTWPAEEAMLRLAHNTNADLIRTITGLVKVGGFIRSSSQTAFQATVKSFAYLTKMLNAIHKLPNVDRERLNRCLDIIHAKRKLLNDIIEIA